MRPVRVLGVAGRPVAAVGVGLLCPAGIGVDGATGGRPGPVPGFRARAFVPDRKSLKLMTRAVQLGVSAARLAVADAGEERWRAARPERRAMYVGASPQTGDPADLRPALDAALDADGRFDLGRFAREGIPLVHPLWLVRGLSNNVLGFSSALLDVQGSNANYCDGPDGGWTALREAVLAVAEGRADLALGGGADALVGAEVLFGGRRCGEGAAFVVFVPADDLGDDAPAVALERGRLDPDEHLLGYLGAATWPVAVARCLYRGVG